MQLPKTEYESGRWAVRELVRDFRLLDVWALPVEGGPGDFDAFLACFGTLSLSESPSSLSRMLFRIRFAAGRLLGWDKPGRKRAIPGSGGEQTLRERLPASLREMDPEAVFGGRVPGGGAGFTPLYRTADEWAAEIANDTVHGVLHLAWAPAGEGVWRAQLAVYAKPRGTLGRAYLALISPFRHLVVYPALLRQVEAGWKRCRETP